MSDASPAPATVLAALAGPWPWWVAGPLLGLVAVLLLLVGNKPLGVSASFRTICSAVAPARIEFFRPGWRAGAWNLAFVAGLALGGFVGGVLLGNPAPIAISEAARADLLALGITDLRGLVPAELFAWSNALSPRGLLVLGGGGLLVGFGASYAGGCTSGHGILGLADLQLPSLVAVAGFFAGGLVAAHLLLPVLL